MGVDKAALVRPDGRVQAAWLADLLERAGLDVVEVGQGVSGRFTIRDSRQGPHTAVIEALDLLGLHPRDLVVVVPVDLYRVSLEAIEWLIRAAFEGPFVVERAQGMAWDLWGAWTACVNPAACRLAELVREPRRCRPPLALEGDLDDADDSAALGQQLGV